jgi:glycosyltransferase involved in cell wall biosynthesis
VQRSSFKVAAKHLAIFRRRFVDCAISLVEDLGFDVEIVLSFYLATGGFLGTHLAGRLKVPHIACVRGNDIGRNIFDPQCLPSIEFVLKHADAIVSVNRHLNERMLGVCPEVEGKSSIIANSIAPARASNGIDTRSQILEETGWPNEAFIMCFNGAIREKKGAFEIIEAMHILDREGHCARLLVVGPDLPGFERAIMGSQFDVLVKRNRTHVLGNRQRSEVGQWLAGGDALLLPSLDDGHANALLEGMIEGLCPIVSGIFAEHVEHLKSGYVLSRVSGATIADAIRVLAQDREATYAAGLAAQQRVHMRTPGDEARDYLAVANRLVR